MDWRDLCKSWCDVLGYIGEIYVSLVEICWDTLESSFSYIGEIYVSLGEICWDTLERSM